MRRAVAPVPVPIPPPPLVVADPPAPPTVVEPAPDPHPLDTLIRYRVLLVLKPDGDKALEGLLMDVVHDGPAPGYWLHSSALSKVVLHEVNEHGQPVRTELSGNVWVDRSDVLYLNKIPTGSVTLGVVPAS